MYVGAPIQFLNLGLLKYEVLKKLWILVEEDSDGYPSGNSFTKYSEVRVGRKINESYSKIAAATRAIRSWFIIPLKATYSQYPLPVNVVGLIPPIYYYTSATHYEELNIYDRSLLNKEFPGWRTATGEPQYAYVGDWSITGKKLGVTPTPVSDAAAIILGTGVSHVTTPVYVAQGIRGKEKTGGSATTYIDAGGQNFVSMGVVVGMVVKNTTDGSHMTITSITTTTVPNDTLVGTGGLSGGSDNTWSVGDKMEIPGGDYGGYTQVTDDMAKYLVSFTSGALPSPGVTMAAGNLLVESFILPVPLNSNTDVPEVHPLAHMTIVLDAAASLALEEPVTSPEYAQGQAYVQAVNQEIAYLSGLLAGQFNQEDMQIWGGMK